jgi:glycosyltransferase involved in cell wall biosynthesis
MRILLADHTSTVSGAQHALLDLVSHQPPEIEFSLACPPGELADRAREMDLTWAPLRGTRASFRLDPIRTPPELADLAASALQLRRLSRGYDLVHANSARAGLIAAGALKLGGAPFVVHLHDTPRGDRLARLVNRALEGNAAGVLAVSRHVMASVGAATGRVEVVYNPLDIGRFTPRLGDAAARERLGLRGEGPIFAAVGQLAPWKAQDDAIRIVAGLRADGVPAQLLIVGAPKFIHPATGFDNIAYARGLHSLTRELGLVDAVHFLGERDDVPEVLEAIDVLLAPSWDEPFGRVVIEAMAMERAVVATSVGGPAEVIADGITGRLAAPRNPAAWSKLLEEILSDPPALRAMGARARASAQRFDAEAYARRMAKTYRSLLGAGRLQLSGRRSG